MVWRALDQLEKGLGATFLALIIAIMVLSVFFRYVLSDPLQWTDEIVMALFIWQVFISAAIASKRGMHVAVDTLVVQLPEGPRRVMTVVIDVIVIGVLLALIYFGWQYANATWNQYTLNLQIPRFWIHLSLPIGGLLMLRRVIEHLLAVMNGAPLDSHEIEAGAT